MYDKKLLYFDPETVAKNIQRLSSFVIGYFRGTGNIYKRVYTE